MGLKIKGAKVFGEDGTFMRLRTNSDTDYPIDIDGLDIYGKGMTGFDISNPISLTEYLGLLDDTDPKDVIKLLAQIQGKSQIESAEIIKKSTLLERLGGVSNIISITTNLMTLTTNPNIQQMIASLSR